MNPASPAPNDRLPAARTFFVASWVLVLTAVSQMSAVSRAAGRGHDGALQAWTLVIFMAPAVIPLIAGYIAQDLAWAAKAFAIEIGAAGAFALLHSMAGACFGGVYWPA